MTFLSKLLTLKESYTKQKLYSVLITKHKHGVGEEIKKMRPFDFTHIEYILLIMKLCTFLKCVRIQFFKQKNLQVVDRPLDLQHKILNKFGKNLKINVFWTINFSFLCNDFKV